MAIGSDQTYPRVSVIIPTYNRADYLREALASVLDQSLQPWEIIVVDDGSTDDTPELARSFPPNVVYIRQPQNMGVSAARNAGLSAARGEVIAWLDSDDLWEPGFLATVIPLLAEDERLDGVYTGRLVGDILHGPGKAHAIATLAEAEGFDLSRCYAYSDSFNDMPMLTMVGHPVAINPDSKLRKYASENGWNIKDFRTVRKAAKKAVPGVLAVGGIAGAGAAVRVVLDSGERLSADSVVVATGATVVAPASGAGVDVPRAVKVATMAAARVSPSKSWLLDRYHRSKKSFMRLLMAPSLTMAWSFSAIELSRV